MSTPAAKCKLCRGTGYALASMALPCEECGGSGREAAALPSPSPDLDKLIERLRNQRAHHAFPDIDPLCLEAASELSRLRAVEVECERLTALNVKLTNNFNTLLIDNSRWEDRTKAAEAERDRLRAELDEANRVIIEQAAEFGMKQGLTEARASSMREALTEARKQLTGVRSYGAYAASNVLDAALKEGTP